MRKINIYPPCLTIIGLLIFFYVKTASFQQIYLKEIRQTFKKDTFELKSSSRVTPSRGCLRNGWPTNGTKAFWKYFYYPEYPSLQDIFEDNGDLVVILSTFLISTHNKKKSFIKGFHQSSWLLFFHKSNETEDINTVVNSDNPIITRPIPDPKLFIILLRFQIPVQYQNKYNFATIQVLLHHNETGYRPPSAQETFHSPEYENNITELQGGRYRTKIFMRPVTNGSTVDLSYRNVPFCQILDKFSHYVNPPPDGFRVSELPPKERIVTSSNGQKKDFLRICTQNVIYDEKEKNELLVRWILYHIEQGFEKPIIYVNKIDDNHDIAFGHFKKLLELDMIEMYYYVFPYAFFFHEQPAQESSCMERFRGRTVWLAHNDADERFYNPNSSGPLMNMSISDLLNATTQSSYDSKIGGFKCGNIWMEVNKEDEVVKDSIILKNQRTKGILIPENVRFYIIHSISSGRKYEFNNDILNAHFKNISTLPRTYFNSKTKSEKMTLIHHRLTKELDKYLV